MSTSLGNVLLKKFFKKRCLTCKEMLHFRTSLKSRVLPLNRSTMLVGFYTNAHKNRCSACQLVQLQEARNVKGLKQQIRKIQVYLLSCFFMFSLEHLNKWSTSSRAE